MNYFLIFFIAIVSVANGQDEFLSLPTPNVTKSLNIKDLEIDKPIQELLIGQIRYKDDIVDVYAYFLNISHTKLNEFDENLTWVSLCFSSKVEDKFFLIKFKEAYISFDGKIDKLLDLNYDSYEDLIFTLNLSFGESIESYKLGFDLKNDNFLFQLAIHSEVSGYNSSSDTYYYNKIYRTIVFKKNKIVVGCFYDYIDRTKNGITKKSKKLRKDFSIIDDVQFTNKYVGTFKYNPSKKLFLNRK